MLGYYLNEKKKIIGITKNYNFFSFHFSFCCCGFNYFNIYKLINVYIVGIYNIVFS